MYFDLPIRYENGRHFNMDILRRMIDDTRYERSGFNKTILPKKVARIVKNLAIKQDANPDLIFIAFIFSVAASTRGVYRVRLQDGRETPLSLIGAVGLESGEGKSNAISPFLCIFNEYDADEQEFIRRTESAEILKKEIFKVKARQLIKEAARKLSFTELAELAEAQAAGTFMGSLEVLGEALKKSSSGMKSSLLVNDLTPASLSKLMATQGYVLRLEPDGGGLEFRLYRQLTKYWSGESHAQIRVSRESSITTSVFIVDLVFTQTEYFRRYVQNRDVQMMGLFARTLPFIPCPNQGIWGGSSEEAENVIPELTKMLRDLLDESRDRNQSYRTLTLSEGAWKMLKHDADASGYVMPSSSALRSWYSRRQEHAIRLAAILHLAERSSEEEFLISEKIMESAFGCVKVFIDHAQRSVFGLISDEHFAACLDIAYFIIEKNYKEYHEKYIKQQFHNKYRAGIVDIVLFSLEQFGLITELPLTSKHILGRLYINNAYAISLKYSA